MRICMTIYLGDVARVLHVCKGCCTCVRDVARVYDCIYLRDVTLGSICEQCIDHLDIVLCRKEKTRINLCTHTHTHKHTCACCNTHNMQYDAYKKKECEHRSSRHRCLHENTHTHTHTYQFYV
jgi:hypothetical protein